MSAKEVTIFVPGQSALDRCFDEAAKSLLLEFEDVPRELGFSYQAAASRGSGKSLLRIERRNDAGGLVRELLEWERPSDSYKAMLAECGSTITICYRDPENARAAILAVGTLLGESLTTCCLVENGEGCLLKLSDALVCLRENRQWTWEKEEFPELPGVAVCEWR